MKKDPPPTSTKQVVNPKSEEEKKAAAKSAKEASDAIWAPPEEREVSSDWIRGGVPDVDAKYEKTGRDKWEKRGGKKHKELASLHGADRRAMYLTDKHIDDSEKLKTVTGVDSEEGELVAPQATLGENWEFTGGMDQKVADKFIGDRKRKAVHDIDKGLTKEKYKSKLGVWRNTGREIQDPDPKYNQPKKEKAPKQKRERKKRRRDTGMPTDPGADYNYGP